MEQAPFERPSANRIRLVFLCRHPAPFLPQRIFGALQPGGRGGFCACDVRGKGGFFGRDVLYTRTRLVVTHTTGCGSRISSQPSRRTSLYSPRAGPFFWPPLTPTCRGLHLPPPSSPPDTRSTHRPLPSSVGASFQGISLPC
jgi:hypothetical protein